jgi:hypothetical protein
MKRFILTEEEKSSILSLYVRKGLITEQDEKSYNTTINSYDKNSGFQFFSTNPNTGIRYYKSENYQKTLQNNEKLNIIEGADIWNGLYSTAIKPDPTDPNDPNLPNIIQTKLFVGNVIYYYTVKASEWVKNVSIYKKAVVSSPTGEGDVREGYELTFKDKEATSNFYVNNLWDLTEEAKRDILREIITPLVNAKGESRTGCIDIIKVTSSASRFRNTKVAGDLTFLQLSEKRGQSMANYILEQLKSKGFEQWCNTDNNIILEPKGEHGDGTSGPNPPTGYYFIQSGVGKKMTDTEIDDSKRNEFGQPHTNEVDYDKYKYSLPYVQVAFKEITTEEKPKPSDEYYAIFKGNTSTRPPDEDKTTSKIFTTPIKSSTKTLVPVNVQCTKF